MDMKTVIYIITLLMLVNCTPQAPSKRKVVSRPSSIVSKELGGNFTLSGFIDNKIQDWSLFSSNGKIRILYFGFTHCPDVCPTALSKLANKLKIFSKDKLSKIQPIFISVDHKRDDAQKVQKYVEYFSESNIGLTGTQASIDKVTNQYGIYYKLVPQKDSEMEYTVDHSSRYIIINKDGKFYNSYSDLDEIFLKDLKILVGK
jgi:cytochrome oxidase Cu insertion factor (SCO1/SenC/PrrC family)